MTTRTCRDCKKPRPIESFHFGSDGLRRPVCWSCRQETYAAKRTDDQMIAQAWKDTRWPADPDPLFGYPALSSDERHFQTVCNMH